MTGNLECVKPTKCGELLQPNCGKTCMTRNVTSHAVALSAQSDWNHLLHSGWVCRKE